MRCHTRVYSSACTCVQLGLVRVHKVRITHRQNLLDDAARRLSIGAMYHTPVTNRQDLPVDLGDQIALLVLDGHISAGEGHQLLLHGESGRLLRRRGQPIVRI